MKLESVQLLMTLDFIHNFLIGYIKGLQAIVLKAGNRYKQECYIEVLLCIHFTAFPVFINPHYLYIYILIAAIYLTVREEENVQDTRKTDK